METFLMEEILPLSLHALINVTAHIEELSTCVRKNYSTVSYLHLRVMGE